MRNLDQSRIKTKQAKYYIIGAMSGAKVDKWLSLFSFVAWFTSLSCTVVLCIFTSSWELAHWSSIFNIMGLYSNTSFTFNTLWNGFWWPPGFPWLSSTSSSKTATLWPSQLSDVVEKNPQPFSPLNFSYFQNQFHMDKTNTFCCQLYRLWSLVSHSLTLLYMRAF